VRPSWRPAREALAVALLRAGSFREASKEFSFALGSSLADSLAAGRTGAAKSLRPDDADDLFGLAVSLQMDGRAREAERLYRTYADFVGTTSRSAARAYYRLHELFSDADVGWGDQAAELSKALAVDPDVESESLLPAYPDLAHIAGVQPYLVPIALADDQPDTVDIDTLPMLNRWVAPSDSSSASGASASGSVPLEILVGADGAPSEVSVLGMSPGEDEERALVNTAMSWQFSPALAEGKAVPARIIYGRSEEPAAGTD
jgi:tetratricopeptide (TPR) repeat protein